jgi:hypothetical protein
MFLARHTLSRAGSWGMCIKHLRRHKLDEAQASFERAVELHRQAVTMTSLVRQLMSTGSDMCICNEASKTKPRHPLSKLLHFIKAHSVLGEANNLETLRQYTANLDRAACTSEAPKNKAADLRSIEQLDPTQSLNVI